MYIKIYLSLSRIITIFAVIIYSRIEIDVDKVINKLIFYAQTINAQEINKFTLSESKKISINETKKINVYFAALLTFARI